MPDLALHIAEGTGLEEPMWCYLETGRLPQFDLAEQIAEGQMEMGSRVEERD